MFIDTEVRSEIIRVRVTPQQKEKFASVSSRLGLCSATHAFKLVIAAAGEVHPNHAHRKPRHGSREGAIQRPLKPSRQQKCPGSRGPYGGATINRMRV